MKVHLHDILPVPSEAQVQAAQLQQAQRERRQVAMSDARRARVLDAARSVFAEKGFDGASIREIARQAGYTAGAIYSYFDSKEAIHAALLAESLERLNEEVAAARTQRLPPRLVLQAKALAWFGFYERHPRDLDLCLYLMRGLVHQDSASHDPFHGRLRDALRPCEQAMLAMGLAPEAALRESVALFAHGVGLLLLLHAGRLFDQPAQALFENYVEQLAQRHLPGEAAAPAQDGQGDLFGL